MRRDSESESDQICRRLGIEDWKYVEVESKHRVRPEDVKDIRKFLLKRKKVQVEKSSFFFDQFLDTPNMDVFRAGASLRLRYKKGGSSVYLQYKGPGFHRNGMLFRSEFSTERLKHVLMEESRHDIVKFSRTSVRDILDNHAEPAMARAMRLHLGKSVIARINVGPILSIYQKEKFLVELGNAFLEPSLDRIFAFHIGKTGPHPLSTFCEFENEIKSPGGSLEAKLAHVDELTDFNAALGREFSLRREPLDKYHRCQSFFLKNH